MALIFAYLSLPIFPYPHSLIKIFSIYKESSKNTLYVCGYQNWIGCLGVCELWKNNVQILRISSQKLYFGDDDALYHGIIQEPVWKWRHNYRHEISRDPFAETVLFQKSSTIFIFRQIDRANFAVRGPNSLQAFFVQKRNHISLSSTQILHTCTFEIEFSTYITKSDADVLETYQCWILVEDKHKYLNCLNLHCWKLSIRIWRSFTMRVIEYSPKVGG